MDHRLVIVELVSLGCHVAIVDAHHPAERPSLDHLDPLVGTAPCLDQPSRPQAEGGVVAQPLEERRRLRFATSRIDPRRARRAVPVVAAIGDRPAFEPLQLPLLRRECGCKAVEQRLGLGRVVATDVADIDVERHRAQFRPGVNRQMRSASSTMPVTPRRLEGVEAFAHRREPPRARRARGTGRRGEEHWSSMHPLLRNRKDRRSDEGHASSFSALVRPV